MFGGATERLAARQPTGRRHRAQPPADLLLLERSYTLLRGIAMRIHRIPLASIKPDTMIDGKPLIVVDRAYQIDNMEGLAVRTNAACETISR
jgi:hypothetical protein